MPLSEPLPVGFRSGRLEVLHGSERKPVNGHVMAHCRCDCGRLLAVIASNLRTGKRRSCGCRHREGTHVTHGGTRMRSAVRRTYYIWRSMRERCSPQNSTRFPNYAGRGIRVCKRWRNSFADFLKDMGECPGGLTIDRKNNNWHYTPSNCRWATYRTQSRNKSTNHWLVFRGKRMTLVDLAALAGMAYSTLRMRIIRNGWSVEAAATTPVRRDGRSRYRRQHSGET